MQFVSDLLHRYADYVFVMAYDYTPTTSDVTGLLAPLPSIVSKHHLVLLPLN